MTWYTELMNATAMLLGNKDPEAIMLLYILLEPTYGNEQEFAIKLARVRGWV